MRPQRVVDAHMHFWNVEDHDWYPMLKDMAEQAGQPQLNQNFDWEAYRRSYAGSGPVPEKLVHVSGTTKTHAYLDETAWVVGEAERNELEMALVCTVDPQLERAELIEHLERQAEFDRFRGVRVLFGLTPDAQAAGWLLEWLTANEHVFDLAANPADMAGWLQVLGSHENLQVVVEHTGWPVATDDDARAGWDEAMRALADRPNIACKMSGLGMTTLDVTVPALRPWLERTAELFGIDRVMYGSNLPIETMAGSGATLLDTFTEVFADLDESDNAKLFALNAERIYKF